MLLQRGVICYEERVIQGVMLTRKDFAKDMTMMKYFDVVVCTVDPCGLVL